jgi:hypothetical protein
LFGSITYLTHALLSLYPAISGRTSPVGIGLGAVNGASPTGTWPAGAWLIESWVSTRAQHHLDYFAALKAINNAATSKSIGLIRRNLAVHGLRFWVSYQPASRFWFFQTALALVLLLIAAVAGSATLRRLRTLNC